MATYWSDMMDRRTCVYRVYIGEDLAYVGITCNPDGRFSTHQSNKSWWADVDRIELEWFDTREEAKVAEREAIRNECPLYNVARPNAKIQIVVR